MENENQRINLIYNEAKAYLKKICPKNINLDKYFNLEKTFKTKNDILYTLLVCIQDRRLADKVIGFTRDDRQKIFKKILFDYDSEKIINNYNNDTLLDTFNKYFKINNIDSKNNLWRMYATSVISSAKFINSFENIDDFNNFIESYSGKEIDLPILLQNKIYGMGFALACHFLKELGYKNYAKPDIHIKDVFVSLNLSCDDDYSVFNAVLNMANTVNDSAYNIDKLFWLICSGNFHMDNILIERHKEDFINLVKEKILKNKISEENLIKQVTQTTNIKKYKNKYGAICGKIILDENIINNFLCNKSINKVIINYDEKNDCLIIKKLNN
ncbi:MAG: hypothetical protein Q4E75_07025 [bacterium]|nr:hypothetical protein [bacterium]